MLGHDLTRFSYTEDSCQSAYGQKELQESLERILSQSSSRDTNTQQFLVRFSKYIMNETLIIFALYLLNLFDQLFYSIISFLFIFPKRVQSLSFLSSSLDIKVCVWCMNAKKQSGIINEIFLFVPFVPVFAIV